MKLGVVGGAGLLGSTSAFLAGMKGYLEEIKLLDVKENLVKNHVMDMAQAIYSSSDTKVTFAQYKDLSDWRSQYLLPPACRKGRSPTGWNISGTI